MIPYDILQYKASASSTMYINNRFGNTRGECRFLRIVQASHAQRGVLTLTSTRRTVDSKISHPEKTAKGDVP